MDIHVKRRLKLVQVGLTPFCRRPNPSPASWRTIDAPHCPRTLHLAGGVDDEPGCGSSMIRCLVHISAYGTHDVSQKGDGGEGARAYPKRCCDESNFSTSCLACAAHAGPAMAKGSPPRILE